MTTPFITLENVQTQANGYYVDLVIHPEGNEVGSLDALLTMDGNTSWIEYFVGTLPFITETGGALGITANYSTGAIAISGAGSLTSDQAITLQFDSTTVPDAFDINLTDVSVGLVQSDGKILTVDAADAALMSVDVNTAPVTDDVVLTAVQEDAAPVIITTEQLLANASDAENDTLSLADVTLVNSEAGTLTDNTDGTYTLTLADGFNGTASLNYTVTDGNSDPVAGSASLEVQAISEASTPYITLENVQTQANGYYVDLVIHPEGNEVGSLDALLTMDGNTSWIEYFMGTLPFITETGGALGITANYSTGAIAISGAGSLTSDQAITLQFDSTTVPDAFDINLTDVSVGLVQSDGKILTVDAADAALLSVDVNTAPVTDDVVLTAVQEDAAPVIITTEQLLANASDAENDTLSLADVTLVNSEAGTLTDNADGTYTLALAGDFNGTANLSYTVTDGNSDPVAGSASLAVQAVNDAPSDITLSAGSVDENSAGAVIGALSVTDADGGAYLYSVDDARFEVIGNQLKLKADQPLDFESESGSVSVVVTATDQGSIQNTLSKHFTISLTDQNDAPVVADALTSATREADDAYTLDLLAGASDEDISDALSVSAVAYTVDGAATGNAGSDLPAGLTLAGNTLTVDPANAVFDTLSVGETNIIQVSYSIVDGNGGRVNQTETITLTGTNDIPTVAAALTSEADEADAAYSLDLLTGAADVDATDVLGVAEMTCKVDGVATGNAGADLPAGVVFANNSLNVNPDDAAFNSLAVGQSSVIEVSYSIVDGNGGRVEQTQTITINGTNDAPVVALALTSEANEGDDSYVLDLLAGASDADIGDPLSISNLVLSVDGETLGENLNLPGNVLTVDPADAGLDSLAPGESSVMVVNYSITDGNGGSVEQSATITIHGTNDAPSDLALSNNSIIGGRTGIEVGALSAFDPESDAISYSLSGVDADKLEIVEGVLKLKGDVTAFSRGDDLSVTVIASDGDLETSENFTISVTPETEVTVTDDVLMAESGNANLSGKGGDDTLIGDAGDNVLIGGRHNDLLMGGEGNDTAVYTGNADEYVISLLSNREVSLFNRFAEMDGASFDTSQAVLSVYDTVPGEDGSDRTQVETLQFADVSYSVNGYELALSDQVDNFQGGFGHDWVRGGEGNDSIKGGRGDDLLVADQGWDSLDGESGDDILVSLAGPNNLEGGSGDDVIVIANSDGATLSARGGVGADDFVLSNQAGELLDLTLMIADFEAGVDTLDLSTLRDSNGESLEFNELLITDDGNEWSIDLTGLVMADGSGTAASSISLFMDGAAFSETDITFSGGSTVTELLDVINDNYVPA